MTREATHELFIVTGLQAGARQPFNARSPLSVGNTLDNDIVLFNDEPDREPTRCVIRQHQACLWIEVLQGCVRVDERALFAGDQAPLTTGEDLLIEDTRWRIDTLSEVSTTPVNATGVPEQADAQDTAAAHQGGSLLGRLSPSLAMLSGTALLLYMLVPGVVGSDSTTTADRPPILQERIAALGFDHVRVEPGMGTEQPLVEGRVANREQWLSLSTLVSATTPATLAVQVDEALAGSIEDIYRMHDVQATISITGENRALAESAASEETFARIRTAMAQDLPEVTLDARNTPPAPVPEPVRADAGKTVEMVIAGEPAYLLTRDQSRYFTGSTLPTGHVIQKITDDSQVIVSLDGVESTLQF